MSVTHPAVGTTLLTALKEGSHLKLKARLEQAVRKASG
jgi:hypothetical protein